MLATAHRWLPALAVLGLLAIGAAPAGGADRQRTFDPTPGVITAPPPGATVKNDLVEEPPPALRRATASAAPRVYTAADGSRIRIQVSDGYAPDPAADQALADFLASLLHGPEINRLSVYVATPSEMAIVCGAAAAASCYVPSRNRMAITGEASFGGLPTDYAAAHEYGHHVANHRKNLPFSGGALVWGTKRWATQERICPGVLAGRYSLSTSGRGYFRNPGEAFAEAYAYYHFPGRIRWEWVRSLHPSRAAYSAIRTDVRRPWRHNVRVLKRGAISRGGDHRDVIRFRSPLDGGLILELRGPRGADLDLTLLKGQKRLRRSSRAGSREHIGYTVCGVRRFKARIDAKRGGGRYRLVVVRP